VAIHPSILLLRERFESANERFLDEVMACTSSKALAELSDQWYQDKRAFARTALLRYIDEGCNRQFHRPLVKRLFKLAEGAGDDEVIAHFVYAFDRFLRRRKQTTRWWDASQGGYREEIVLRHNPNIPERAHSIAQSEYRYFDRKLGKFRNVTISFDCETVFTRRTRRYLQRRAFRYLRRIGLADPIRYNKAVCISLALYRDDDVPSIAALMDSWGLTHIMYGCSPFLRRLPHGIVFKPEYSFADICFSPVFEESWKFEFYSIIKLLEDAKCTFVAQFSIEMLKRHHLKTLNELPFTHIRSFLFSPLKHIREFGFNLLQCMPNPDELSVSDWLSLSEINDDNLIKSCASLIEKNVDFRNVTPDSCILMASSVHLPFAELGFSWVEKKPIVTQDHVSKLFTLFDAPIETVRIQAGKWIYLTLQNSPLVTPELILNGLDSRFIDTRELLINWMQGESRFRDNQIIWSALAESPYDDVKEFLVQHLALREKHLPLNSLRHIWASTILAINRGAKAKKLALYQLTERIIARPSSAEALLPLLKISLRSGRPAEQRIAMHAVCSILVKNPDLALIIRRIIPELAWNHAKEDIH
jgi:hypothetical protein